MDEELQKQMEQLFLNSEKEESEMETTLLLYYKKAIREMKSEINILFMEYLDGKSKSLTELNKKLTNEQLTEIKETLQLYAETLEDYDNPELTSLINKLNNMQDRIQISRLSAVMIELECILSELLAKQEELTRELYKRDYEESFDKTVYAIQTILGVGVLFNSPTKDEINLILKEKYLGESFSTRIWKNQAYLLNLLQQGITQGFIQGESANKIAERIAKVMNIQYSAALRLVKTELNAVQSAKNLKAFESQKINKYMYCAILDSRTSKICRKMNGNIYLLKDAKRGVNLPPLHPNCRSFIVPYLEDNQNKVNLENGEDGYYAVNNVSYKEWKNSIKK